jgi:hypothetical protein
MDIKLMQIHCNEFIDNAVELYKKLLTKNEKVATENFFNHAGNLQYELSQLSDYEPKSTKLKKMASIHAHSKQVLHWLGMIGKLDLAGSDLDKLIHEASIIEDKIANEYNMERKVVPVKQYF